MYSRDNHFRTSVENRAESYYNLGNVFYQQGDLGAAESSYRQAIAYRPNWAIAYYNLAVVLDASGRLEAAESTYRQAISLQPDYVKAYSNLGCVLVKLDKLEEAIEVYQKALAIDSNWATLYNNLGQTLQAQGKPREALSAYTQAIRLQPDMLLPYYNAGKIWQGEGIHSSAVEYFQRCIQLDPNYLVAYAECGNNLMAQRQLEAAMACFQKAISLQPAFVTAYCHRFLETLPHQSGQNPETDELDLAKIACARFLHALQQSLQITEISAHLWQTYVHLGNVLFEYGEYQSAEIYYHNALQIDHNRPEIYGKLSECLAKQNRSRAAMPPDASPILQQGFEAANAHYPQGSSNLHPHGVYLAAKDWLVQAKFDGVKYIESGGSAVESNPGNQKLSEADISLPEKCRGLNCAPCLGRINRQFATIHLGNGIYSFDKNRQTVTVDYPRFTAVIPEGRAWIVPQKNSWMICNAIAIITPDNYLLADVSREYPGSLPGCQRHDASKHRVLNLEEFPALEQIDGTVAVLSGLSGNVYFHWLVDVLPRLDILHSSGIKWEEIDYFLINSLAQPFQRETLAALGIPEAKIIESDRLPHIQAKQLLVPSFPGHLGWLQPQALQFLRREFLEKNPPNSSSYPERIYISRAKARYRRVINEAEVIEFLAQFGFQVIETESLSFFAQLAVFERAKIIVAPHGSGLTNIIFCRPGTQVIELVSPHYVRPYYWVISQMLGLEHYYLTGEVFACYPLRELMYQNPLTEDIQVSLSQLSAMMKIAGIIKSNPSQAHPTTMPTSVQPETALLQLHRQAEVYLAEGNLEAAEAACRQAVKIQPQSAAAWKILGNIRQAKGQVEEAQQCYMKAIELQPNFAAAYANLGSLYAQQQQWDSAIYCYQQAIKIEPKFAGVYRNLAKVWTQLNKSAEAADCSYAALSLEPEKFSAPECVNLGNTLVRYGKMDQGISCYRRALTLNPNLVGVYQNLGEALKRQGKLDEAAVYYQKAIELSKKAAGKSSLSGQKQATQNGNRAVGTMAPEDADACIVLAEHYGSKGKWAEAIAAVQKAISLKPKSAAAYKIFGKALQSTGKLEEARQCYLKALQLQPNFAEVHANLGSLSAQQQRWQAAISHYQKALELNPQFAGAYRNLAKVFERSGQPAAAALSWYQALTLEPQAGTAEQYLTVGNAVFQQGKVDEALSCYRRAIELNPNLSQAYHNVGEVLSVIQEWDEAIDAYRQSIEVKPDNAGSHYGLAKALGQLERWEDAVVAYRQVIELNGSSAEIYHQFADALANLQQWEEAASAYRQAIELNQNNSWSYNNLGGALIKLERWEEAVTAYRRAIELNPEFHWSYYNLGDAVAKLGEWDEAVRAYQEAVKLQPDLPWISQKLGDALRERAMSDLAAALGCYRQAIKEHPEDLQNYHKALEIQPNDAELYVQLANGLARQGNSNGAIVFYQMALQLQPDNSEGLRQLEELSKKKFELTANFFERELTLTSGKNQTEDVRLIAFYLPQYHPIPENDLWWGKGFTEWTNVTKAQPLFEGHYQPHLPADLGFYDLRVPEVREQQAALARQYGIYGFCYYYYWFAGKRLLHRPLDEVLATKKPDFPFCICWANENWTRRWDGYDNEILMAQDCSNDEQNQAFAEHIVPILLDERYIRVNGDPLLIIYRADLFPNLLRTAEQWRDIFRKNGVGEVHLCVALTFGFDKHPHEVGFDSAVQFPPHALSHCEISSNELGINDFSGKILDYNNVAVNSVFQQPQDDRVFLSVMTSWDNTARRKNAAHIYTNSSPELYEFWLRGFIEKTKQVHSGDERLVFINAWNEWAEGAHLEPDIKYGYAYLTATKRALLAQHSWKTAVDVLRYCTPSNAQHLEKLITDVCERIANADPDPQAVREALVKVGLINYLKSYPNLTPKSSKLLQDLEMLINYYQP